MATSVIEMNDKTIVEVDFWENQTYKTLQGSWSVPIYGIQKFSDSTGKINFKHEKTVNDSVYLPIGWEWCDKSWSIDHSGRYGEVDTDGWSYAASVESLVESTRLHSLKADRSAGNLMRRRRWTRHRRCMILDVVAVHMERVNWAEGVRSKMKEIEDTSRANYDKLSDYYTGQKDAVERVVIGTDNSILEVIHEFNELNERLLALKAFLLERGAIEEAYSQKLDQFSKKWISEGDAKKFTPPPGTAQPVPYLLTSDPAVDIFAAEGTAAAFWNSTTHALKTAANTASSTTQQVATNAATAATFAASAATVAANSVRRISVSDFDMAGVYGNEEPSFDSGGLETNPASRPTAETTEVVVTPVPDDFSSSNPMLAKEAKGSSILDDYYYSVCLANRTTGQRLHSYSQLLTQILPQQVDGILEVLKEAVGECRHEGREIRSCLMINCRTTEACFNNYTQSFELSQVELRADSNLLHSAVYQSSATVDSPLGDSSAASLAALAGYSGDNSAAGDALATTTNRFSNMEHQDLWLAIQLYFAGANSVDSVLLMYHAFSKMQMRKLRELSATVEELLHATLKVFSSDQFKAWEDCSSALAALGSYRDILQLQSSPDADASSSPGKGAAARKKAATSVEAGSEENEDGSELQETSGRNNASVFRSHFFSRTQPDPYIAYHGRLSYCTCTRAEAHAGGQDYSEHSMWTEAIVLVSYNRVMHIMQIPQDGRGEAADELKYVKENVIMSVNVRNVLVRPMNIPREGYRDAFEVLLAGSGSKKLSLLGSFGAGGKDITSIMFLTHDSFQMRSWMRIIVNPFTDPSKEPPDGTSGPVGATKDGSASPGQSATLASGALSALNPVDTDSFSFSGGAEDMVSGTNSLRDINRLRGASSAPPPASPVTPTGHSTAERFTAYSGSDAINDTNPLRKLKKTPSSASVTGSLNPLFNAAASAAAGASAPGTPTRTPSSAVAEVSLSAEEKVSSIASPDTATATAGVASSETAVASAADESGEDRLDSVAL